MSCNEPTTTELRIRHLGIIAAACARAGIYARIWFYPMADDLFIRRQIEDVERVDKKLNEVKTSQGRGGTHEV